MMTRVQLTHDEERLVDTALRGNYGPFIEHFFRTPRSGTWYTRDDRVEQFSVLYEVWRKVGQPEDKFDAEIENRVMGLEVVWDPYYDGLPMFLLPHGFRILDWIGDFVSPQITRGAVTTGTGSGKTANVAVAALAYCALLPGFRFLNGGPTQHQSDLMLGEAVKWATNAPFEKFLERGRGANPYWVEKHYPTIRVHTPFSDDIVSTFICQTIVEDANNILGGERDWINIDEAQLVENMLAAEPRLVTRMRGTRESGLPRWTKLTFISNPGDSIEFLELIERYQRLAKKRPNSVLVMQDVPATLNIYITTRQIEEMRMTLSDRQQRQWLSGSIDAVITNAEIPRRLLEGCRDRAMDEYVEKHGKLDEDFGILEYELPFEPGNSYLVVGDAGKSPLNNLSSLNVPCLMAFDVTKFPVMIRLVAFSWIDKADSYKFFTDRLQYLTLKYRCKGYYDAGNIQSAFEDVGPFANLPFTEGIYFSGSPGKKQWSLAVVMLMLQHRVFRWPMIKGLWHQGRIYDLHSKKKPDDIVTCLLVLTRVFAKEGTYWTDFVEHFGWEFEEAQDDDEKAQGESEFPEDELEIQIPVDRYSRHVA